MGNIFHVEGTHDPGHRHGDENNDQNGFSDRARLFYEEKPYWGVLPDADIVTELTGTCGDTMTIYLKIENGVIADVKMLVLGCNGAVAAAMAVADLIRGKTLLAARAVSEARVLAHLGEVPAHKHHCLQLSVKTLQAALDTYEII